MQARGSYAFAGLGGVESVLEGVMKKGMKLLKENGIYLHIYGRVNGYFIY